MSESPMSAVMTEVPEEVGHEASESSHLGSWVELHEEPCRNGRMRRLLVNHATNTVLSLDEAEASLIRSMRRKGFVSGDPNHAELLAELGEGGFLAGDGQPQPRRQGLRLSLSDFDLRWDGADRFVHALYRRGARHLFHPLAVVAQIVLGLLGALAVGAALFNHGGVHLRVQPAQVPIILGLSVVAVAIHETAHALVVIRHGRSVDAMGFRLLLGAPSFYVESVDALLLTRRQRLIQAVAGPWAEWLVVSVVALFLLRSPALLMAPLLRRFIILNSATIASNLIPFAGLDGSWILADALGEPDIHQRSRGALTGLITNALEGTPQARGRAPWPATALSMAWCRPRSLPRRPSFGISSSVTSSVTCFASVPSASSSWAWRASFSDVPSSSLLAAVSWLHCPRRVSWLTRPASALSGAGAFPPFSILPQQFPLWPNSMTTLSACLPASSGGARLPRTNLFMLRPATQITLDSEFLRSMEAA